MNSTVFQTLRKMYRVLPEAQRQRIEPSIKGLKRRLALRGLSWQQFSSWEEKGYLVLPGFYSAEQVAEMNSFVDQLWNTRATAHTAEQMPYMLECYIGDDNRFQRLPLRDAADDARNFPFKLLDLYLDSEFVRAFTLDERLAWILRDVLEGEPLLCNSINFEKGSTQDLHVDSWYMSPAEPNRLVAAWIALEDIHPDSGPIQYVEGSHKIPPYVFESTGATHANGSYEDTARGKKYVSKEMEKRGMEAETFACNAGDVFIWHAQLVHGGSPILDSARTRRSLVTHYWRCQDIAQEAISSDGPGRYYLNRQHPPSMAAAG